MLMARLTVGNPTPERKNKRLSSKVNSDCQSGTSNVAYTRIFQPELTKPWTSECATLRKHFDGYSIANSGNTGWRCFTGSAMEKYREIHNSKMGMLDTIKKNIRDEYERTYKVHMRGLAGTPGVKPPLDPDVFIAKFYTTLRLGTCPRPKDFDEILEVDKAEIEAQYAEDMSSFKSNIFDEMTHLLGHVVSAYDDTVEVGKSKSNLDNAKSAPLKNLQQYVGFAKDKNLFDDPMFDLFVDKIQDITKGVTAKDLKDYSSDRDKLRNSATELIDKVKQHTAKPEDAPVTDDELFSLF